MVGNLVSPEFNTDGGKWPWNFKKHCCPDARFISTKRPLCRKTLEQDGGCAPSTFIIYLVRVFNVLGATTRQKLKISAIFGAQKGGIRMNNKPRGGTRDKLIDVPLLVAVTSMFCRRCILRKKTMLRRLMRP